MASFQKLVKVITVCVMKSLEGVLSSAAAAAAATVFGCYFTRLLF